MQSSGVFDETSSLADSAYELISSTDGESQDGRGTDSLAASITSSFNFYPRADDVLSLNGNETTNDEDDDEEDDEEDEDEEHDAASSDRGHLDQSSGYLPTATRNTPGHSQLYHASRGNGEDNNGARRSSPADSIRYAEQALCNPSTQSLSTLEYDSSHGDISGGRSPLNQSIEFDEGTNVKPYIEKVSVKHTVREFSEGESAIIAANMGMTSDAPKRMAATVCQTMSRHCLSTREPLRVLYVGNDGAYDDITHKISSALLASAPPPGSPSPGAERRHSSTAGIYNIMPISAFGSAKVPEIDEIQLMGVSEYYIKVDRCVKAAEIVYEGESFPDDTVYSIELDSGMVHSSVFNPSGSVVTPEWALPHVAVFYVSGNDDDQAETTRSAAWEFMTRHAVPSIFVSHAQSFSRSPYAGRWQNFVDHAAVHLSLESRDPSKPMVSERLPIDLGSFLNIDARQMNRNLAYLTGLKDSRTKENKFTGKSAGTNVSATFQGFVSAVAGSLYLLRQGRDCRPEARRALRELYYLVSARFCGLFASVLITVLLSSALLVYTGPGLLPFGLDTSEQSSVFNTMLSRTSPSTATQTSFTPHIPLSQSATVSSVCSAPSVAPTVTISFVTTKTVEVQVSKPTSLSSQVLFGGYLTDNAHSQRNAKGVSDAEIKSTGCSIQVYSSHEIMVKVPAATKTKWLAKGAIDIDVWQGQKKLKSKLFTTDEGIIIEIDRKDAFGVMSVHIVTTLRPKINETFAVDFGQLTASRLLEAGFSLWQESVRAATDAGLEAVARAKTALSTYADEHNMSIPYTEMAQAALGNASLVVESATRGFTALKDDLTENYKRLCPEVFLKKSATEAQSLVKKLVPTTDATERLRDDARFVVRRAQIASKLWWLRVQGKTEEHDSYEEKATNHIRNMELDAKIKRTRADAKKNQPRGVTATAPSIPTPWW
ncbi:hypothetical protein SPBR_02310 [Sporothrix brasiliensis 5110]|uniref:Uncharacterized protein n=1 Tax=Sporothrix brasiliensis 5110 TaxID=1398154 RepID=A0A0C2J559_9PEZI|nr:uncharacterized protein SPBR_02310 [Sporothrix brasiliensis 5110]KIH92172.1 hypothetical protein SPBR_02310 [Sporothrix brasiliensis 5110]